MCPGVEDDDDNANAEAKVDSSTSPDRLQHQMHGEIDGSDGSPDSRRPVSRPAPLCLAFNSAARGPGTHSRGGLGPGGTEGGGGSISAAEKSGRLSTGGGGSVGGGG